LLGFFLQPPPSRTVELHFYRLRSSIQSPRFPTRVSFLAGGRVAYTKCPFPHVADRAATPLLTVSIARFVGTFASLSSSLLIYNFDQCLLFFPEFFEGFLNYWVPFLGAPPLPPLLPSGVCSKSQSLFPNEWVVCFLCPLVANPGEISHAPLYCRACGFVWHARESGLCPLFPPFRGWWLFFCAFHARTLFFPNFFIRDESFLLHGVQGSPRLGQDPPFGTVQSIEVCLCVVFIF